MSELASWDWDTKEKLIADIHEWKKKSIDLRELTPSDDGEKIAAIVQPVNVTMRMFQRFLEMFMDMVFSQMQPYTKPHQAGGQPE